MIKIFVLMGILLGVSNASASRLQECTVTGEIKKSEYTDRLGGEIFKYTNGEEDRDQSVTLKITGVFQKSDSPSRRCTFKKGQKIKMSVAPGYVGFIEVGQKIEVNYRKIWNRGGGSISWEIDNIVPPKRKL